MIRRTKGVNFSNPERVSWVVLRQYGTAFCKRVFATGADMSGTTCVLLVKVTANDSANNGNCKGHYHREASFLWMWLES